MNINMKKIVKKIEEVVEPVKEICTKPAIAKLEPFGNDEMHKLVAKINEIIDHAC